MRRTEWLKAIWLVAMALAPSVTAQEDDSNNTTTTDGDAAGKDLEALLGLPQCALGCLLEMRQEGSECGLDDIDCMCRSSALLEGEIVNCVMSECTLKESLLTRGLASKACNLPVRDNSQTYTTLAITLSIISGVAVLQRFLAKMLADTLTLGTDDYMVLLAAILQAPMAAIGVEGGVASGLGRDIWTLEFQQITDFSYWLYIFTVIYFLNIAIVKLAFLFFYLRVFPKRSVRRWLWGTVAFTVCFGITFVFAGIFQCQPISYYWTRWTGETTGSCVHVSAVAWANSAVSIALDLWMIAIPLSQVHNLNLDWKKKAEVAFMFCVGLFVTVMSCLRLESLVSHDSNDPNATWAKQEVAIWSTVEVNVGIICACLPSIRTLVVLAYSRLPYVGSANSSSKHLSYDDNYRKSKHFGTISRSIAEPIEGGRTRRFPADGIRMETTYQVSHEYRSADDNDDLSRTSDDTRMWDPTRNRPRDMNHSSSEESITREKDRNNVEFRL